MEAINNNNEVNTREDTAPVSLLQQRKILFRHQSKEQPPHQHPQQMKELKKTGNNEPINQRRSQILRAIYYMQKTWDLSQEQCMGET